MKYVKYDRILNLMVTADTRAAIEGMAADERRSMAEVARDLIEAGMRLKGIA